MKCKICNKECNGAVGLVSHLNHSHKLTSKQYYDDYVSSYINNGICRVCGKETKYVNITRGYLLTCSKECSTLDEDRIKKIKNTKLVRYGSPNYNNIEKYKETCEKKYGSSFYLGSDVAKNRIENVLLEKYGVSNISKLSSTIQKIRQTNFKRYGTEKPQGLQWFKDRKNKTNLEKYGNTVPCNRDNQGLSKATKYRKYGTSSYNNRSKSVKTVQQIILDIESKYQCTNLSKLIKKYGVSWLYLLKNIPKHNYYNTYLFIDNYYIEQIERIYLNPSGRSLLEKFFIDIVLSYFPRNSVYLNSRKIIPPLELDIYIPSLKLAIELNGTYYHSFKTVMDKDYHQNKSNLCRLLGIRLIHIYEFEDIVEQGELLKLFLSGQDLYPNNDFNKNNLIGQALPESSVIYNKYNNVVYGVGELKKK